MNIKHRILNINIDILSLCNQSTFHYLSFTFGGLSSKGRLTISSKLQGNFQYNEDFIN